MARIQGEQGARIASLEMGQAEIKTSLRDQSSHLTRQDAQTTQMESKLDATSQAMRVEVTNLNTKITGFYSAIQESEERIVDKITPVIASVVSQHLAPLVAQSNTLAEIIQEREARTLRRIAWLVWLDNMAGGLGMISGTLFVGMTTILVNRYLNHDLDRPTVAVWVAITVLFFALVARVSYTTTHVHPHDVPESSDEGEHHPQH